MADHTFVNISMDHTYKNGPCPCVFVGIDRVTDGRKKKPGASDSATGFQQNPGFTPAAEFSPADP
jgi:hypothetical protein